MAQGEHDMNGVLSGAYIAGGHALRVLVVDPSSDQYRPKDENGTWSDCFDGRFIRVVFVGGP